MSTRRACLLPVLLLFAAVAAAADEAPAAGGGPAADQAPAAGDEVSAPVAKAAGDDGWHFRGMPYIWATEVNGDVSANGASTDVSMTFSDILRNLNFALMGTAEARKGRFVTLFDGFAAWLEDTARPSATSVPVPGLPGVIATVGPSYVKVKLSQIYLDLKGGWRVLSLPSVALLAQEPAGEDTRRFDLDLFAGARYWHIDTKLRVKVPVTGVTLPPGISLPPGLGDIELPSLTTDGTSQIFESSSWWVDPVVGLRTQLDLTPAISLSLLGDLGGFDIGSASKFTWKTQALVSYRLSERWTLAAGYQALNLQREKGDAKANLTLQGPLIGLEFEF